jgi:hypothetical protein
MPGEGVPVLGLMYSAMYLVIALPLTTGRTDTDVTRVQVGEVLVVVVQAGGQGGLTVHVPLFRRNDKVVLKDPGAQDLVVCGSQDLAHVSVRG